MSFIFYILKVYYLQTKSTKKRSKRFFDKHCLSAYCCKKVYIYLSFSSASSNQPTVPFAPSRGFTWVSWTMTMWAGLQKTEQLVIIFVTVAPPSSVLTTNIIGKHMKTMVAATKPNIWFVLSGLFSQFFLHPLIFFLLFNPPNQQKDKKKNKQIQRNVQIYVLVCWESL